MPRKPIETVSPQSNKWFLSTVALLFALAFSLSVIFSNPPLEQNTISGDAIKTQMQGFIRQNLIQPGMSATIKNVSSESGVYKFGIAIESGGQKQEVTSYATKDGKLFFVQGIKVTNSSTDAEPGAPDTGAKSDRPEVDLYVMSFCPYGVQAENAMKPVADLLGEKITLKVRFIANVGGDTPDSVQSLHGAPEAGEDLRQACVMKNYNSATYWKYVSEVNANCYPVYRDAAKLDACWKSAAEKSGIDTAKITSCSTTAEGVNLLKADDAKVAENSVRGSPTIFINGNYYSGQRTADAFKEAICSAFTTVPAECGAVVQAPAQADTEQHSCG